MTDWQVLTTDLVTGQVGPEVPLTSGRWTTIAGRPTEFEGSLPLRRCPAALLEGAAVVLHLVVGGLFAADAILWDPRVGSDAAGATVNLRGESLASYWWHRKLRTPVSWTDVDEATIIADLVDLTEADGRGIGLDTSQVATTGKLRTRTEWDAEDRPWIGDLIRSLQELEDGPTVAVVVDRPDDTAPPTRTLQVRRHGAGATIDGALRRGEAIIGYDLQVLGSQAANDWEVIGAGEGADMVVGRARDTTALSGWPQLDGVDPRKTVQKASTARSHARANLARAAWPPVALTVDLDPDARPRPAAWRLGDILDVQLVDGPLRVRMPMRAAQKTWTVSNGRLSVAATLNSTVTSRPALAADPAPVPPTLRDVGGVITAAPA